MAIAINKNLGMLCLAVYLILLGLSALIGVGLIGGLLPVLALIAGVLILIGK